MSACTGKNLISVFVTLWPGFRNTVTYMYVFMHICVRIIALNVDVSAVRKLEDEEESYKFTNAFTSAGEGSVLDIAKRYRQLQHNMRASAVRASKKVYKIPAKEFFCSQSLVSYKNFC